MDYRPGGITWVDRPGTKPVLHLPHNQDAPRVKEAKQIVIEATGQHDPSLVPFAMRMNEAKDAWLNSKRR